MQHTKLVHPVHNKAAAQWLHVSGTISRIVRPLPLLVLSPTQVGPVWAGYAFFYGYNLDGHAYVVLGNVFLLVLAIFVLAAAKSSLRPHRVYTM